MAGTAELEDTATLLACAVVIVRKGLRLPAASWVGIVTLRWPGALEVERAALGGSGGAAATGIWFSEGELPCGRGGGASCG